MKKIRSFIGIPVPKATYKLLLDSIQLPDKSSIRWTKAENVHLTLAFLGDVPISHLAQLGEVMAKPNAEIGKRELQLRCLSIGHFPSRKPKLIAAHLEVDEPLLRLKESIDGLLDALAIPFDRKPFKPHITLGRCRKAPTMKFSVAIHIDFFAPKIIIYQSVLTPTGSDYTPLTTVPFQGNRTLMGDGQARNFNY